MLKRNDILLILFVLFLSAACFFGYFFFFNKEGSFVNISVDGKTIKTLPLSEDCTYTYKGEHNEKNIIIIKNGYASIKFANCPDKLCVHQNKINKKGETIVCLPHKLIISVISSNNSDDEIDGTTN